MQTVFTIIVLLYYLSIFAELYWLAVPSLVSTYEILKSKKPNRFYIGVLSALALGAFVLPLLNIILSFLGWHLIPLNSSIWLIILSILFLLVGRIFTFWGTLNIREHLKQKNNSVLKSGIFSISRHPIATGLIISLIGFNLAYLNVFLLLLSFIFFINMRNKVLQEEALLLQQYPLEYPKYIQQSRRYI